MENRFGVKDFVLFALVIILILVVILAMVQYDHQMPVLKALKEQQDQQSDDLATIRRDIERGVKTNRSVSAGTQPLVDLQPKDDPFARIKAAEAAPDYASGDMYMDSGPNTNKLTPLTSGDSFAASIQSHVIESLLTRDPQSLEWTGLLALPGWKVEDNTKAYFDFIDKQRKADVSAENIQKDPSRPVPVRITFKLRPGLVFSDGIPLTVDDVVWTFNFMMNDKVDAPRQRAYYSKIRKVFSPGGDEVVFEFDEPYFDAIGLAGGMSVVPKHFYEKYSIDDFNKATGLLLGSGPYKMTSPTGWNTGDQVELIRNDHYWGEPPAIGHLLYRIITQDLPRMTAFTNGELDYFAASPEQYKSLLKNQDVLARSQHLEYETANGGYRYIAWNELHDGKPTRFADKRVRQAMTLLTDKQRICDDIMLGLATPASGPFNRLGKQCDPAIQPIGYDPDRAKALLKDAGYTDDGTGALKGPDGKPFEFKLTYPNGSPVVDRMVLLLRDSYARAGVTLIPDRLDWAVLQDRLKARDFEAISLGWTAGIEDDIYQMFDSSQMAGEGEDFMSYKNPDLDHLMETARSTVDESKRIPMWRKCHDILNDDQPYTFLFTRKSTVFMDKRIHNVLKTTTGLNPLEEWYVPTGMQKYKN